MNLSEYYEYLENDTDFHCLDLNTCKYITTLRDKTAGENTKKLCSYELFFAAFSIEKGVHIPESQMGSTAYPTLELFDDNFDYIKVRAEEVKNPKYKAKYNHLLWLSPQKHIDFAKQSIENYLLLLQNSSFSVEDDSQCYSFAKYFENLFVLCQEVNHKKDEVIQYFILLLESEKLNDFTKYSLMDFIVTNGKKIDASITQTFYNYSNNVIEKLDSRVLESYLNLLIILSQKLNLSPNVFHEKLGDYHNAQLKIGKNQGFTAHRYYTNALEEYKKANNKEKIEQTSVLLERAKKAIDFKNFPFEGEDKKFNTVLNQWWDFTEGKTTQLIEKKTIKISTSI